MNDPKFLHKYFKATMNEVKVLAMLRHPNIIEYRESFLHERVMIILGRRGVKKTNIINEWS